MFVLRSLQVRQAFTSPEYGQHVVAEAPFPERNRTIGSAHIEARRFTTRDD
jgi:hypothetical protein